MADKLIEQTAYIIANNKLDMQNADKMDLSSAMKDRLLLDDKRVQDMASSLRLIASLRDPVGKIIDGWTSPDGLKINKVSVPIGVIGIIYESRPNVTSDTAGLCFKSGNVCVLKGGKEAQNSNEIIAEILQTVLVANSLPASCISLLPDSSREGVASLIKADRYVDLIIPRGGEGLIRYVNDNSTVPVVKHDKGLCHTYIDKEANAQKAIEIAINAKCQRPGVCNAMETLLVHRDIAKHILPILSERFEDENTKLRGCFTTNTIIEVDEATDEDWNMEYLANILSIKIVQNIEEAVAHISKYGSGHSEAIISENYTAINYFLDSVDAACVYANASTRFTDGAMFGFGAEVGISTNKLHARGPMGIDDLTTYKFKIYGDGHIR
jgi:glutamate-5-semialdehyde dehydrogenase